MSFDCVVCGTCCVDLVLSPMQLDAAFGVEQTRRLDSVRAVTGGLVNNAGNAMGRLGMKVAALTLVGQDHWASIILDDLKANQVDTSHVRTSPNASTSVTAVLIDDQTRHGFAYHSGVMDLVDGKLLLDNLDLFASSRVALIGYYALKPEFDNELPSVLPEIRATGCQIALDAAGGGGSIQPLDRILPHLDYYIPSRAEAASQTGESAPEKMIEVFRNLGASKMLGIKLGADGALLSPEPGQFFEIAPVAPPGKVIDTTGAGDSFYAGLLTGLLRGMAVEEAGRLGAAAGACCVTEFAGTAGIRDFDETARIAGIYA